MDATTRVVGIVLSDVELPAVAKVLAFHGGSVLYPKAWARLTTEFDRRRDGEQAQPIWMPGDVFDSLPSAVQMLLRGNIVDELNFVAA